MNAPISALENQHRFALPPLSQKWPPIEEEADSPPEAVSVADLIDGEVDQSKTLLGNRYLERGGSMVIVGSSGIGKSSSSMQQDILWGIGREAFGIKPSMPLKILTIQAENDRGDLTEMGKGVMRGLKLTTVELELLRKNVHYAFEQSRTGSSFLSECVRPLLERHRPDILRIDPFMAYLGGDITHAKDTAAFLRQGLNPLLTEFGCACILVHHTTKTAGKDTSKYRPDDFMYIGAGSADIVNWARAVLFIESSQERGKYRFLAAKRGGRIGWKNKNFEKTQERWFQHAKGSLCWEECEDGEIPVGKSAHKAEDVLKVMPRDGTIEKQKLINKANNAGIPIRAIRGYIDELIENKLIVEEQLPRTGSRAQIVFKLFPKVKSEFENIPKKADL